MEYIQEEKKKRESSLGNGNQGGYFIDKKLSSDGMEGLFELLHESYSFYSAYYEDQLEFKKNYDNNCLDWYTDNVIVESVGEDLLELRPFFYGAGSGIQTKEELELEKKHAIIVPRKALMEFIKLYRCADQEEWTIRRIEFDGKDFRLWLDGKEYTIDQDKLDRLEIYHKYGR